MPILVETVSVPLGKHTRTQPQCSQPLLLPNHTWTEACTPSSPEVWGWGLD